MTPGIGRRPGTRFEPPSRKLANFRRTRRKLTEEHFRDWSDAEKAELLRLPKKLQANVGDAIAERKR